MIYERVWGYDFGPASNALRVYIGYLRRKLEDAGARPLMHTVRGVGYVLREPVSLRTRIAAAAGLAVALAVVAAALAVYFGVRGELRGEVDDALRDARRRSLGPARPLAPSGPAAPSRRPGLVRADARDRQPFGGPGGLRAARARPTARVARRRPRAPASAAGRASARARSPAAARARTSAT